MITVCITYVHADNEASQDTYHHEEKMAMGADLFESDKSNLY